MNFFKTTKASPIKIGLVGLGRWGLNYFNTLKRISEVEIVGVTGKPHQFDQLKGLNTFAIKKNWKEVCLDPLIDGLIVATPPETHYEIAKFALQAGVPVLVEKPFTLCKEQTNELLHTATKCGVLCMVNYIHLFSKGYNDLKENIERSGEIKQIYTECYADGPFRATTPVLWDWGCHSIAACIDLLGRTPLRVEKSTLLQHKSVANAELITVKMKFSGGIEARCTFGNAAEFKRRDLCVVCDSGVFIYDGLSEGLSKQYSQTNYSEEKYKFKSQTDPLTCVVLEFIEFIKRKATMHHTLQLATQVNKILSEI